MMGVDLLNVRGLEAMEPGAPVVMVNLMRFRERSLDGDGSGWDAYLRYSALTVPMIKARGRHAVVDRRRQGGRARRRRPATSGIILALVYYPTVSAFIEHDDVGRLTNNAAIPSHQRLRRACDHRDQGSVQQVQGGVASVLYFRVDLRCSGDSGARAARQADCTSPQTSSVDLPARSIANMA